ncbi:hypothetical protein SEA_LITTLEMUNCHKIN_68 [Gordonia phage LittleMunchkin]|nr:hypothetical protein SEA_LITTLEMUNCHKIN_68 [Gordonia phage LittleMunchkin]
MSLPDPTEFHGGIEMWNTYPRVSRRGQDIRLGSVDAALNDNEALALAAALASAAQRAQAERTAHAEVERQLAALRTEPLKRFDELTGTRPLPGQIGPGRVTPDTEAAAALAAQGGEITHLVYEGEIVADVVNADLDTVCEDRQCILCGAVFDGAEGHECRAHVLRGAGLF